MLCMDWRCYILPLVAFFLTIFLSLKSVDRWIRHMIPDYYYAMLFRALILFGTLFVLCRIMDLFFDNECHNYAEYDIKDNWKF